MVNHGSQIEIIVMNVPPATILSTVVSRLWSKLTGGRLDGRGAFGPPPPGAGTAPAGTRAASARRSRAARGVVALGGVIARRARGRRSRAARPLPAAGVARLRGGRGPPLHRGAAVTAEGRPGAVRGLALRAVHWIDLRKSPVGASFLILPRSTALPGTRPRHHSTRMPDIRLFSPGTSGMGAAIPLEIATVVRQIVEQAAADRNTASANTSKALPVISQHGCHISHKKCH